MLLIYTAPGIIAMEILVLVKLVAKIHTVTCSKASLYITVIVISLVKRLEFSQLFNYAGRT